MRHVASSLAPSLPLSHQRQDVSWALYMCIFRSLLFFQPGNHLLVTWLDQPAASKQSRQGQLIVYLSKGLLLKLSSDRLAGSPLNGARLAEELQPSKALGTGNQHLTCLAVSLCSSGGLEFGTG